MNDKIILYSTGCPKCRVLEAALKRKSVVFEHCSDVNKMIELGFKEAPVLQVGDKMLSYNEGMKYVMEMV